MGLPIRVQNHQLGVPEAELDTPNRSKSPLRNAALTYDEYMKALVDDVQAEKDRVMFEEAVTVENVGQQIDNTRRVLDRSQLGLKPVPKRKPNGKNVKDGAEKPPLPRRKYVARRGGAASSAGGSKAKKGTKKVKKHDILDEVTKKQMHSATQLSLLRTEVNGSFFSPWFILPYPPHSPPFPFIFLGIFQGWKMAKNNGCDKKVVLQVVAKPAKSTLLAT